MNIEPTKPYVYQPDAPDGTNDPKIYAVAGPGTEEYRGRRFTKDAANFLLKFLLGASKEAAK